MRTILLVDDSMVDRCVVGGVLHAVPEWKTEYAADGREAFKMIEKSLPDLVLTDLVMPEVNGLELTKRIRERYPRLPVVLMTAHGSEAVAVEALQRGAANYVPKTQVAERLISTIREVFSGVRVRENYHQLVHCMCRTEFGFVLNNNPSLIESLVDLIQRTLRGMHLVGLTSRNQVGAALREALWNSMLHGNLEISDEELVREELIETGNSDLIRRRSCESPYCERRIHVDVKIHADGSCFVIRDEGRGFDVSSLPDPRSLGGLDSSHGRGIALIRSFMDEVTYNATGNEITMCKRPDQFAESRGSDLSEIDPFSTIPLDPDDAEPREVAMIR